jgi:hypothetical protein
VPIRFHVFFVTAAVAVTAALSWGSGVASAATTLGQTSSAPVPCASPITVVQKTLTSGNTYVVPGNGVISSWSTYPGAGGSAKLKILQPGAGADQYKVVAESASQTVTASSLQTFASNVPVQAGDIVGLETTSGSGCAFATTASDVVDFTTTDPPPNGTSTTYSSQAGYRANISATLTSPPTSTLSVPGCSKSGALPATVTADSGTTPKAIHYKIDGGSEQTVATTGSPGAAVISVPEGQHSVEYWGEDQLGQLESQHHTAAVVVDHTSPTLTINSDQHRHAYNAKDVASITTVASDSIDELTTNPSRAGEPLSTLHAGSFSVSKTATDQCANSATATFSYTVAPTDTKPKLSPGAFTAGPNGGGNARKTGTRISYRSSDAGKTRFTIVRSLPGIKRGKACVAVPKKGKIKHSKRCTRNVKVGSFSHKDTAGANSFHFTGRVGGSRLNPGPYRLDATPTAAGKAGRTVSTGFRVKP